jgi:iron complex transport system substrate-binding protein
MSLLSLSMPGPLLRHFACALIVLAFAASRSFAADTSRIVSIGGAVTEILYGLGMDKTIVGIDTTSLYPPRAATEKASVGYMRALSAEGVLGLRPTLIIASEGSGPKETMSVLQAAQIPLVIVPELYTGDGILQKIHVVADAAGVPERGKCMTDQVSADLGALDSLRSAIHAPKRVMFVLSVVNGRAMAAGHKTAADGIIRMAGAVNVISEYDGYKPISDEAVIAAKPDVILAMEGGGPNPVTADTLFALPAFSATPAAAGKAFVAMDGLYLLGFGPRTARAARDLAIRLYPELARETPAPARADTCHE